MKSSGFSHFPGAYRVPQKIDSKDRKSKRRNPLHSEENIFNLFKMLSVAFGHRHRRLLSYLILILRTAPIFPLCPAHKKCYTMKKQGGNSTCI